MSIYAITGEKLDKIAYLFEDWNETLIWSCLQECMGTAWADDGFNPVSAQLIIADFCFLAGKPNADLIKHKPVERQSNFVIMVPQNEKWANLIQEIYQDSAVKIMRYAIKKEADIFDRQRLRAMTEIVDHDYTIRIIDEEIYKLALSNNWSRDLCSSYKDYQEYSKNGLGVAALHNGELVAGASSYTFYRGGIEIEIDTREDHRRKGLAAACGAGLILECLYRNLYPSWDAHNKWSVALAEKLGYHFDKEYAAYEVNCFGQK